MTIPNAAELEVRVNETYDCRRHLSKSKEKTNKNIFEILLTLSYP